MSGSVVLGAVAVLEMTDSPNKRRVFGLPETWVGWTSVGVEILSLLGIFNRRFIGGFRGVFAGLIIAGVVALLAVLWKKERSILIWIPLGVGLLAAIWTIAEVAFPH